MRRKMAGEIRNGGEELDHRKRERERDREE